MLKNFLNIVKNQSKNIALDFFIKLLVEVLDEYRRSRKLGNFDARTEEAQNHENYYNNPLHGQRVDNSETE